MTQGRQDPQRREVDAEMLQKPEAHSWQEVSVPPALGLDPTLCTSPLLSWPDVVWVKPLTWRGYTNAWSPWELMACCSQQCYRFAFHKSNDNHRHGV